MFGYMDPRPAVGQLIERVAGRSDGFTLELIDRENGADVFEVDGADGRVILRGSGGVALATAFNHYLKYTAGQHFAYAGPSRVCLPDRLPPVREKTRVVFPYPFRHYFNNENCEYSYTTDLFDRDQWTQRLDWMAMNGINIFMFGFTAQPIWLALADKLGLRQEHIDRLLKDDAHGIPTGKDMERNWQMGRFVAKRAYELGMEPEFRPFYGIVPDFFTDCDMTGTFFEGKQVLTGSPWHDFPGPKFFGPRDDQLSAFNQLAQWYYEAQREVYGLNEYGARQNFFIGDCCNEAGFLIIHPDYPVNLVVGRSEAALRAYNPDATWISSSWRVNKDVYTSNSADVFMVLDLYCECEEKWRETEGFWGKRWLWSMLHNFGGNNGMSGGFDWIARGPIEAKKDPLGSKGMSGVGISPEGGETNPALYDLMGEMSWRSESPDVDAWLRAYALRRYGRTDERMDRVWDRLHRTVYSRFVKEGPFQTLAVARPRLTGRCHARFWGTEEIPYPPGELVPAWEELLCLAPDYDTDTYRYDLVDVGRQVLADYAKVVYGRIRAGYEAGDAAGFAAACDEMIALCEDMDRLVGTRPEYLLGRRLAAARAMGGADPRRQDEAERAERTMLTIWVPETPGDSLEDYCNRLYSGLLSDYYAERWRLLRRHGLCALEAGKALDEAAFNAELDQFELAFTRDTKAYPTRPREDAVEVSRALLDKYRPRLAAAYGG